MPAAGLPPGAERYEFRGKYHFVPRDGFTLIATRLMLVVLVLKFFKASHIVGQDVPVARFQPIVIG